MTDATEYRIEHTITRRQSGAEEHCVGFEFGCYCRDCTDAEAQVVAEIGELT